MSPERLGRKGGFVPAGDVYALGIVLYEGLGRRRLFAGVELRDQLQLAHDPGQHDAYVRDAVNALHHVDPRVRDLLLTLLAFEEGDRPTAAALAADCEGLANALPGPNLRQWCRGRAWPGPSEVLGELGGRILTESRLIADSTNPAPPREEARKAATMVDFLDESSTLAPANADTLAPTKPSGASPTLVALAEDEVEVPVALRQSQVKTVVIHPEPVAPKRRTGLWTVAILAGVGLPLAVVATLALAGVAAWGLLGDEPVADGVVRAEGDVPAAQVDVTEQGSTVAEQTAEPEAQVAPEVVAIDAAPTLVVELAPKEPEDPNGDEAVVDAQPEQPQGPSSAVIFKEARPPQVVVTKEPEPVSKANVRNTSKVPVELRGAGYTHKPGQVPPGAWEIWADFGSGMVRASETPISVTDGQSWAIKCSALRLQCSAEGV
jgi:hypothetical protein